MGNVANVGLMAQKAEEYGSHDKTFEIPATGKVVVTNKETGEVFMEHSVEKGDVWRMATTKDIAIKDWVKLAVNRARATGVSLLLLFFMKQGTQECISHCVLLFYTTQVRTIFWLDKKRAHDKVLIEKVNTYLKEHDTDGLDLSIMRPVDAVRVSMERATDGKDTISVTGNGKFVCRAW